MPDFDRAEALNRSLRASGPRRLTEAEEDLGYGAPTFVGLPDGRGSHLVHVLDGCWFTQRTRQATAGRDELWVTSALAPLITTLIQDPLPLASGGDLEMAAFFHPAIVGPAGWLPEVAAGSLIGLRLVGGRVEVTAVEEPAQDLVAQQRVRALLARHLRHADDWYDDGDGNNRRHALTAAVAGAVLEDPDLLRQPLLPLDELLHDPLREQHRYHWRDSAAAWQEGAVSFTVGDMPAALHQELNRRAAVYGMGLDQFIVAVLGHLAWRTPFAEDLQPWDSWIPDDVSQPAEVAPLRSV